VLTDRNDIGQSVNPAFAVSWLREEEMTDEVSGTFPGCTAPGYRDMGNVRVVKLMPDPPLGDYRAAMAVADAEAGNHLGDFMLLSWYDRDRDFEAPQHVSECHSDSAVPGYVDYALYRGATLMVDIDNGRFVFFYLRVAL
jgi:hypothetical protein